ncbi:MAG: PKD domain-containing protein, partial [Candidatus Cloacimonadaceae bacterium]
MKYCICLPVVLFVCLFIVGLQAQDNLTIYLTQDFSLTTFPPTGWTISANSANWSRSTTANAGGTSPEARLYWSPQFTTGTYLISPAVNTSGISTIFLEFNHFLDHYATPYTIGVATRSNTSDAWSNAWSVNPGANIGPLLHTITINNADVGSSTFQFAFFFTGDSYNLDYWYIDNIKLFTPFSYDLAITEITIPTQVVSGTSISPVCKVRNSGSATLTAKVSLNVYKNNVLVLSHPDYFIGALSFGMIQTVTFPSFSFADANEVYEFVFSVVSQEPISDQDMTNNSMQAIANTWTTARQQVLLEIGTGTWCPYCPGAAMGADDLISNGKSVAVLEHHYGDTFANTDSNGRNSYNSVTGYPTAVFDGVQRYVGGSNTVSMYSNYLPIYNQLIGIKSPAQLFIYGTNSGDNYSIVIRVQKNASLLNNLALHLALTESDIAYSWQGQTELDYVTRKMIPNYSGTSINLIGADNGNYYYNLNFTKDASWVTANCELVAFLQDTDSKQVLQSQKMALTSLQPIVYPITAAFTADVTSGMAPLLVQFTDQTVPMNGNIVSWLWNFGDEQTSNLQNPNHLYTSPGLYDVSLTVTDTALATDTLSRTAYINVSNVVIYSIELLTPDNMDFGSIYVEEHSSWQAILIRNTGNVNIVVSDIHFESNPLHFEFEPVQRDLIIAPGTTDSIRVRFKPLAIGELEDNIYLLNNSTNLPELAVSLRGNGILVLPRQPQNVVISRSNNDIILHWDAV